MKKHDHHFYIKSFTEEGWFSGHASVYNTIDLQKDVVMRGAFSATLGNTDLWPKMLWQHDPLCPIGKWMVIEERTEGLYVEGKLFLELEKAKEAWVLLKERVVNALSIGFHIVKAHRSQNARILEELSLQEISLVTFPANPKARILDVKKKQEVEPILMCSKKIESLLAQYF